MAPLVNSFLCCFSLKTGCVLIGVFYLIFSFILMGETVQLWTLKNKTESFPKNSPIGASEDTKESRYQKQLVGMTVTSIFQGICAVFLICGAVLEIRFMLIPWVVMQIMLLIALTIFSIWWGVTLFELIKFTELGIHILVVTGVAMLVSVYFLIVVVSYSEFLRDSERDRQTGPV